MAHIEQDGFWIPYEPQVGKDLVCKPQSTSDYPNPPSFKAYLRAQGSKKARVPLFWGREKYPGVRDNRPDPPSVALQFNGVMRKEQRQDEAFRLGMEAMRTKGGGLLALPPGFGKTTIALAIASKLGVKTLILVHKEFLAAQWKERIQQFCPGATVGRVQQAKCEVHGDFAIGMIQTLCSKEYPPGTFKDFGLVIVDECHHISSRAFSRAMYACCPKYTLGLSGTPQRKDGLTHVLHWFLGPTFLAVERKGATGTKVNLVRWHCPMYLQPPPTNFGKINLAQMINEVVASAERTDMIVKLVKDVEPSRKILILSDRRNHCEQLARETGGKLYIGGMKEADLEESARSRVIVATFSMAAEGLDIPTLDTLVLASPKSDVKQAVGRIMRGCSKGGGSNSPEIWDIVDGWSILLPMSKKRQAIYRQGGFEIIGASQDPQRETQKMKKGVCLL